MLDVRRLSVLSEVARAGSLSAAADALSFTQPAVSKQIALLERETGVALVQRQSRGVRLTEAGRLLVTHADDILARLDAAASALSDLAGLRSGTLRLGAFHSAFAALLPTALRAFAGEHPAVALDVRPIDPEPALVQLARGELDLALAYEHDFAPLPQHLQLDAEHLLEDPMLVALAQDHRLARRRHLNLDDLAREPWIQGARGASTRLVLQACLAAGYTPRIAVETSDPVTTQGLVAAGIGITLLPSLARATARTDIAIRPLVKPPLARRIHVVIPQRQPTPAAIAMRDTLRALAVSAISPPQQTT